MAEWKEGNAVQWAAVDGHVSRGIYLGEFHGHAMIGYVDVQRRRSLGLMIGLDRLEPVPPHTCLFCGNHEPNTPEEIAQAAEVYRRDFGGKDLPPPERRISLCEPCAVLAYELDAQNPQCSCEASRGRSVRCTCAWRRAQPFRGKPP